MTHSLGRNGEWIHIFMFFLFFFLLIVALALLFIEKNNLQTARPDLEFDLLSHKADVYLASLLRQPVFGIDINGDGLIDEATLADVIVLNENGTYDTVLWRIAEEQTPPNGSLRLEITYPGRQFHTERLASPRDIMDNSIAVSTFLPGQATAIEVRMAYADEETREQAKKTRQYAGGPGGR